VRIGAYGQKSWRLDIAII